MRDEIGLGDFAHADVDVDAFRDEVHPAVEEIQADLEAGMPAPELGQERRYVIAPEAEARADANESLRRRLARADRFEHLVDVLVDALRPRIDRLAFLRDRHPTARAVEELDLQALFENRDALGDIRGRRAELVGRRRE